MSLPQQIDALYDAFCGTLPRSLAAIARVLPQRLALGSGPTAKWSEVFTNEITLAAPALVADAMPEMPASVVRDAFFAHLLAIIEAFGTDRVEDRQVEPDPPLLDLLARLRGGRDAALRRVFDPSGEPDLDFARADARSRQAMELERRVMRGSAPIEFERYEQISLDKQSVGFPACLALARAAGWNPAQRLTLSSMLASIWLGLQLHDDVIDWEDDSKRDAAWPLALARGLPSLPDENAAKLHGAGPARRIVLSSGVMARMLKRAYRHLRAARMRASVLGADRIATWARSKESNMRSLARSEARTAGFAVRERALSVWASEVLA
jgi:hypothetical protein